MQLLLMLFPPSLLLLLSPLQFCQGSPGHCRGLISSPSPLPSHSHIAIRAAYTCTMWRAAAVLRSIPCPFPPSQLLHQALNKNLPIWGKWMQLGAILSVLSFQHSSKSFFGSIKLKIVLLGWGPVLRQHKEMQACSTSPWIQQTLCNTPSEECGRIERASVYMWVNLREKAWPKKKYPGTPEFPGYLLHKLIFDISSPLEEFRWSQRGRKSALLSCRRWPGEGRCVPAAVLTCSTSYSASTDLLPGWDRGENTP